MARYRSTRKISRYMKILIKVFVLLLILAGYGCSPKVSSSVFRQLAERDATSRVVIYTERDSIPPYSEEIGSISVGDKGFSKDCSKKDVYEIVKVGVRKQGGNAFKVERQRMPNLWSSCYRVKGAVFVVPDKYLYEKVQTTRELMTARELPKYGVSISVGSGRPLFKKSIGRQLEGTSLSYENYINKEITGLNLATNFDFYFSNHFGVGLVYNYFYSSDEKRDQEFSLLDGTKLAGDFGNTIREEYFGANVLFRSSFFKSKVLFNAGFGLGVLNYRDSQTLIDTYQISGNSFGFTSDISLNYFLNQSFALGVGASWVSGILDKYDINDSGDLKVVTLSEGSYLDISRMNSSFLIRYFW